MKSYLFQVDLEEEKLNSIFERLTIAQEEIRRCYEELRVLGVVKIKSTDSGN